MNDEELEWQKVLKNDKPVDAQMVSDFEHHRRTQRSKLTLMQQPLLTITKFFQGAIYAIVQSFKYCLSHTLFIFLFVPLFAVWLVLDNIPGIYSKSINDFEFWVQYTVWWVGLGILSSVGLGSGLQSGVLFLFPHIFKVCLAARTCNTLDFDSASDMWFRQPENLFQCPAVSSSIQHTPVTFLGVWAKVILPCFLQSAGTAIGEIPPYWMARSARLAAMEVEHLQIFKDEDPNALPEELEATSQYSIVNYLKEKMILFLHTYGFYGVLLMASYPNLAFDLCGVCCGHFLMPFMSFFMATFLGKAVIRNSYQSFFYVMLCSEEYLEYIIRWIQHVLPDDWALDQTIRDLLEQGRESFQRKIHEQSQDATTSTTASSISDTANSHALSEQVMVVWNMFMTLILTTFFLSCLAEFSQCYQRVLDDQDAQILRLRVPAYIVEQIASPTSGRWHLPAPTPLKTLRKVRKSVSPLPVLPPLSTPKRLRTPLVSFKSGTKSGTRSPMNLASSSSVSSLSIISDENQQQVSPSSSAVPELTLPSQRQQKEAALQQERHPSPHVSPSKLAAGAGGGGDKLSDQSTSKVLFASPTSKAHNSPSPSASTLRQRSGLSSASS